MSFQFLFGQAIVGLDAKLYLQMMIRSSKRLRENCENQELFTKKKLISLLFLCFMLTSLIGK